MLSLELSQKILTIGCSFDPPKGGIAQVLWTYQHDVFPVFHFVVNSKKGSTLRNLLICVRALIVVAYILATHRNIRIVHIHTASNRSFVRSTWFGSLARVFNRKVVYHIHGGGFKKYVAASPKTVVEKLQRADAVIALSETWKQFFAEEICCRNVYVLGNVIARPKITERSQTNRSLSLLYFGLITGKKGIFDLIEGVANCRKNGLAVELHIGGNGDIESMNSLIDSLALREHVHYHGWVSGEDKERLFNDCDLFVLPSYVEGLPLAILEAMSYGKPIISTYVGAIPEIVENGVNGVLINPGDKEALSNSIATYVNNPQKLTDHASHAMATAQQFLPEHIAQKLGNIYNCLLNDPL
jgi:glycosyltransferase involved in cell wall biosynthesis